MRRRDFIAILGGTVASFSCAARAQQTTIQTIGYLDPGSAEANHFIAVALKEGLTETGYVEGKNLAIEYRWANGQYERLPALAAELVASHVAAIAVLAPVATLAAKQATTSIPIVFGLGSDPVRDGIVASLSRPGGNITGTTFFSNVLDAKRLDFLRQLVPNVKVVAFILNPRNAEAELQKNAMQEAARSLGVQLILLQASTEAEIDDSFTSLARQHADALYVAADAFLSNHGAQIATLALRYGLATSFAFRNQVTAGGLMSYGASITDAMRQVGRYVGRILRGENPSNLPVQQPTKFEFVVNLKTALALGLTIPQSMLLLADEVIE
jgi:putative ABC transport system substrate-binding protein